MTSQVPPPPQLSFQYILYVNPDKEQAIINLVHPNAKIVVQSVHKLPRPLPDFLTGTPILAEPNRSRLWRGVREVTEQLANYNEFLYFHIPEWYRAAATPLLQRFPVSADNLPAAAQGFSAPVMPPPAAILPPPVTPPIATPTPPPVTAAPVMANSAAPVMALAPVDVSGSPNETLPPIIPPINGYRLKGSAGTSNSPAADALTPPPAAAAAMTTIPTPTPTPSLSPPPAPQPAFPPVINPTPARRFQYGANRAPAATPATSTT